MVDVLRLVTVHPALVHFTIGALPVIVLGYGVAARRKSARFTFAADVALVVTALLTLATAAFGLVSNAVVPWPGGLAMWRWLHVGLGIASTVLLVVFAAVRLARRRAATTSGGATFVAALAVALVVGATGWIGGEVLVFRSGMAVRAAGDGALAPAATRARTPRDLVDAMDRLRAAWATTETTTSAMIVQAPRDRDFATVEQQAHEMAALAQWIATDGPRTMPHASAPSEHHGGGHVMTVGEHLSMMAGDLGTTATALERAARARDIVETARRAGEVQAVCADCHDELRWHAPTREARR